MVIRTNIQTQLYCVSMATTVRSQRRLCNICKSGDAIRNKDALIVMWHSFGIPFYPSCDPVNKRYTNGVWPDHSNTYGYYKRNL